LDLLKKRNRDVKEAVELVVLVAIVVGAVLGVDLALQAAMRTSIPIVVVDSGSMEPTLNVGDVCIIQNVAPDQYAVGDHFNHTGDVIVFDASPWISEPVIHRIVDRRYDNATGHYSFLTEGDHNSYTDPWGWVDSTKVYGKVISVIPWIGNIFLFLRGGGVWLVIPILTILIVVMIVKPASEMEKKFKEKVDSGSTQDIFLQQLISR
jgi:signal peptidase